MRGWQPCRYGASVAEIEGSGPAIEAAPCLRKNANSKPVRATGVGYERRHFHLVGCSTRRESHPSADGGSPERGCASYPAHRYLRRLRAPAPWKPAFASGGWQQYAGASTSGDKFDESIGWAVGEWGVKSTAPFRSATAASLGKAQMDQPIGPIHTLFIPLSHRSRMIVRVGAVRV